MKNNKEARTFLRDKIIAYVKANLITLMEKYHMNGTGVTNNIINELRTEEFTLDWLLTEIINEELRHDKILISTETSEDLLSITEHFRFGEVLIERNITFPDRKEGRADYNYCYIRK